MPAVQLHTGMFTLGIPAVYKQKFGGLSGLGSVSLLVLQLQSLLLSSYVRSAHISALEHVQFWLTNQASLLSIDAQVSLRQSCYNII